MILKRWIDKPRYVTGGIRNSSSWVWGLLDTVKNMSASKSQNEKELVEVSRSEIHRKLRAAEEEKKEMQCFGFRRRWSNTKTVHTELIIGDDFQRKAEAKIENEEVSGCQEKKHKKLKKGQDTGEASSEDSVSSVNTIQSDSLCRDVGRRKRQRTELKEIDGREKQEHQKENKTTETEDDEKKRGKDLEHQICVITWNVNKSSAQYDFLCDMAQCQANVVMFQETPNWQADGTAEELGWTLLKEQKDGKAAIAVRRQNVSLLRHPRRSTKVGSCGSGKYPVSVDVLATHLGVVRPWKSITRR